MTFRSLRDLAIVAIILSSISVSNGQINITVVGIASQQLNNTLPAVEAAVHEINLAYRTTLSIALHLIVPSTVYGCVDSADDIVHKVANFYFNRTELAGFSPIYILGASELTTANSRRANRLSTLLIFNAPWRLLSRFALFLATWLFFSVVPLVGNQ